MAIGRLRHYLKYQTYSATQNDYNEDVEGYTDSAQIWGKEKPTYSFWARATEPSAEER